MFPSDTVNNFLFRQFQLTWNWLTQDIEVDVMGIHDTEGGQYIKTADGVILIYVKYDIKRI
jgi:hypothetical protein